MKKSLLLALFAIGSVCSSFAQPNILFILCDDLGYGDLGVLYQNQKESKKLSTPLLDTMAQEGMILNRHYSSAPVCAPSRSSLFTGLHQGHANIRNNQFDKALEDNHTLATTLKSAGYYTSLIGKYGIAGEGSSPSTWPAYPTKRGFDDFYGYVTHVDGHQHYPAHTWALGTYHPSPKEVYDNGVEVSAQLDKCYTTDLFTARAKQTIIDRTTQNPDQPFFIFLAFDTPHAALQLPTVAYPEGSGLSGGLVWNGTASTMINTATGTIDDYYNPLYASTTWPDVDKRFATMVTRIDHCVGDLLQTLKDLNIDDNTIVVFSSDNGPHNESYMKEKYAPTAFQSYGPLEGMKRDSYEGGIRVPSLAWGPGNIQAAALTDHPSQFHDWLATFCDYAGVSAPARTDGVSLKPMLSGSGIQKTGVVYVEYDVNQNTPTYADFPVHGGESRRQMQVIYLDGYKGIRSAIAHSVNFKIYDTATDLSESSNLATTSPYFIELQKRMKDEVLRVRQPDATSERPYDNELVPALSSLSPLVNGIRVKAYEGDWNWVPEFIDLAPVAITYESDFATTPLSRTTNAGLLYTGYIHIPTDGTWTFYTSSDEGTILRIHESLVIDDDLPHNGTEASGTLKLQAGYHPFRLYYRTGAVAPALQLKWEGPGVSKQEIPDSALFRVDGSDPQRPVISSFSVSPALVFPNETVTFLWQVEDAMAQIIDQGVGDVTGQNFAQVMNPSASTYTLTATNEWGSTTQSMQIDFITTPPVIHSFTANRTTVPQGESITFAWNVEDGTSISIDPEVGDISEVTSIDVVVSSNTTYTLTATNPNGSTNSSVDITTVEVETVLQTDFTGFTTAGTTISDFTWSSTIGEEASATTDLALTGSAIGFLTSTIGTGGTGPAVGVAGNIETVGPWSTHFTFTPTQTIELSHFEISSYSINGRGGYQTADHVVDWALEITSSGTDFSGDATGTERGADGDAPFSFSIDTTGTTLNAGTVYTVNLTVSSPSSAGNNIALDRLTLKGVPTSAPRILNFSASPSIIPKNGTVSLSWEVEDATSLSIDQGIGDVTGSTNTHVMVLANTTYTLTAINDQASTTQSLQVMLETADPVVIIRTDFSGFNTTTSPSIISGFYWVSNFGEEANATTSLELTDHAENAFLDIAAGTGGTGPAVGIQENLVTKGPWSTSFTFTPSQTIEISSFEISTYAITGSPPAAHQADPRSLNWALEITSAGTDFTGNITETDAGGDAPVLMSIDTTGTTLNAGTAYTFNLTVSTPLGVGVNVALDTFTLKGIFKNESFTLSGSVLLGGIEIKLSWEATNGKTYIVQTNANLSLPEGWVAWVTNQIDTSGIISVTNIMDSDQIFFRILSD